MSSYYSFAEIKRLHLQICDGDDEIVKNMNFVLNYSTRTGYVVFIGPKEKKDEYSELPSELNSEQKKSAQHQFFDNKKRQLTTLKPHKNGNGNLP